LVSAAGGNDDDLVPLLPSMLVSLGQRAAFPVLALILLLSMPRRVD